MLKENQRLVWEGIIKFPSEEREDTRLIGGKCKSCGKILFPKRAICPECLRNDTIVDHALSTRGKIYSYTVVRYPTLLGIEVPYAYGFVTLPKDNLTVLSIFTEHENLEINMDVELTVDKLYQDKESGKEIIGYKFKPLRNR